MKKRIAIITAIALLFAFTAPVFADGGPVTIPPMVDAGAELADASAGSGSGSDVTPAPEVKPSDAISNPLEHPAAAVSEAKDAKKYGWAGLVFFVIVALTKALAYAREKLATTPLIGKFAAWLAVGKRAVIIAALGALGVAGYDALVGGGTLVAALFAALIAAAGVMSSTTRAR